MTKHPYIFRTGSEQLTTIEVKMLGTDDEARRHAIMLMNKLKKLVRYKKAFKCS